MAGGLHNHMAVATSRLCCLSYQPVLAAVSRAIVSESPTSVLLDKMRSATMLSWPLDSALICFSVCFASCQELVKVLLNL